MGCRLYRAVARWSSEARVVGFAAGRVDLGAVAASLRTTKPRTHTMHTHHDAHRAHARIVTHQLAAAAFVSLRVNMGTIHELGSRPARVARSPRAVASVYVIT